MIAWCVEIKCQLDITEVFIADLIACSTCFGHHYAHHQELKIIIRWYFVLWFSSCWSGAELRVICPVCRMLRHLVGILFPHINDDARSKSHQRLLDGCTHLEDFFRLWFFFRVVTLFNLGMIIFNASEVTVHVPRAEEVMIWRSTWVWGRGTQRKCGSTRLLLKLQ